MDEPNGRKRTSTVGLPLESRISRALTLLIVASRLVRTPRTALPAEGAKAEDSPVVRSFVCLFVFYGGW